MRINKPKYIIIHHVGGVDSNPMLDTSNHTFEIVNEYHKNKWNFKSSLGQYIGYHYFIDKKGKVTQGRADTDEGAHCIGKNLESLGVCLSGNFDVTLPTKEQIESLRTLLKDLMEKYNISISNVIPHRKFASKSCFGNLLTDNWIAKILETPQTLSTCQAERDVIKLQEEKISNLQRLLEMIIRFFNKK